MAIALFTVSDSSDAAVQCDVSVGATSDGRRIVLVYRVRHSTHHSQTSPGRRRLHPVSANTSLHNLLYSTVQQSYHVSVFSDGFS